jgi:hypothetical protein
MDQNLMHRIRERAYEIWTMNGCPDGEAEQHWLRAEAEILNTLTNSAARPPVGKKTSRPSVRPSAKNPRRHAAPSQPLN